MATLETQRGTLILEAAEAATTDGRRGAGGGAAGDRHDAAAEAVLSAATVNGGGRLADALRTDPAGAATRLLGRAVWVPDMAAALAVQPVLPIGWIAVTREGAVVWAAGVITLGRAESLLERRAELDRLAEEVARLETEATAAQAQATDASKAAVLARAALDATRDVERRAGAARRATEEVERQATRRLDQASREAAWRGSQATRFETDRDRLRETVRQQTATVETATPATPGAGAAAPATAPAGQQDQRAAAIAEWEQRVESLRTRRDQLAAEETALEARRHEAENRRARSQASANLDEQRIAAITAQTGELARREEATTAEREGLGEELAAAGLREAALRAELDELRSAAAVARSRLADAELQAGRARERLRATQERSRVAEVANLEARMALDSIRDQVLVELAGLGELGISLLGDEVGDDLPSIRSKARANAASATAPEADADPEAEGSAETVEQQQNSELEQMLAAAAARWKEHPGAEPPPPSKLAQLRRRFHELGAPNPFASEEYAAVKLRLDGLEAQRNDLITAISKTRALIEQLNAMIATQFRSTFTALETAFDARFRQLFGGGFARLSMTEPEDLAATGIEIVARPPGKKAQPLSMLSGGERALTAVALLFSMLEVHPVPFCVLDEVDAALDEANVFRFADALRTLSDNTQFIVITHNRGTIENADALYGVTVGEDAVSRVISLKLEEARELADQVTKKAAPAG